MIIKIILKTWKDEIKLIESNTLFIMVMTAFFTCVSFALIASEIYIIANNEFFVLLLINAFIIIYNKPTILLAIFQKRSASFFIEKRVFLRFLFFHLLKNNPLFISFIFSQIAVLMYVIVSGKVIFLMVTWVLSINFYIFEIYRGRQKCFLLIFCVLEIACLYFLKTLILLLLIIGNTCFLINTVYKVSKCSLFTNYNKAFFSGHELVSTFAVNALYFLRMPLQDFCELLIFIIILCVAMCLAPINIVLYIFVSVFLVEIEFAQDAIMEDYESFYGKMLFSSFSAISSLKIFHLSAEFKVLIRYLLLSLPMLIIPLLNGTISVLLILYYLNMIIFMYFLAYRNYLGTQKVLRLRHLIRHTWFRLVMTYFTLCDMSPILFSDVLQKITGYRWWYGYFFTVLVTIIFAFLPTEKIINIEGELAEV